MNITNNQIFIDMADSIHASNVVAGWWTDLSTNVSTLPTRNRAELMMLVVSEVSEADHGLENNINDDKLPHLPMFAVELADVSIRLFDMIGAEASLYSGHIEYDYTQAFSNALRELAPSAFSRWVSFFPWIKNRRNADTLKRMMAIINTVSAAMEHLRKGRTAEYRQKISEAQAITFAVADLEGIDLFSIIQEKRNFNANRSDHKISNRAKEDGKKF